MDGGVFFFCQNRISTSGKRKNFPYWHNVVDVGVFFFCRNHRRKDVFPFGRCSGVLKMLRVSIFKNSKNATIICEIQGITCVLQGIYNKFWSWFGRCSFSTVRRSVNAHQPGCTGHTTDDWFLTLVHRSSGREMGTVFWQKNTLRPWTLSLYESIAQCLSVVWNGG